MFHGRSSGASTGCRPTTCATACSRRCVRPPAAPPTRKDKTTVPDGHYPLWGYAHTFTQLDALNSPSAAAKAFILNLSVQAIDQHLLDDLIDASLTPQCAMKVERTSEIGDFAK